MLIAVKRLYGCSIRGLDDHVGTVKDLLFEGSTWKVRYLDVDTGHWLPGRRVILAPSVVQAADYANRLLGVSLTRKQVEDSPPLDAEMPVSRRKEIELARSYAWGAYWANLEAAHAAADMDADPDLRSARAVTGYHIQAMDGEIGHVADFIMDDQVPYGSACVAPFERPFEVGHDVDDAGLRIGIDLDAFDEGLDHLPVFQVNRRLRCQGV